MLLSCDWTITVWGRGLANSSLIKTTTAACFYPNKPVSTSVKSSFSSSLRCLEKMKIWTVGPRRFRERRLGFRGRAPEFCVAVAAARWSRTRRLRRCGSGPRSGSGPRRWPAPQRRGRGPGTAELSCRRRHCSRCLWRYWGSPDAPPDESCPGCSKWPTRASSWTQRETKEWAGSVTHVHIIGVHENTKVVITTYNFLSKLQ